METWEESYEGHRLLKARIGALIVGVALDIGPRILWLSHVEKPGVNVFGYAGNVELATEDGVWRLYGGHRLWVAPEKKPRSYSIDDKPVNIRITLDELIVEGPIEQKNCVKKIFRVRPGSYPYEIIIHHEVVNICRWPIRFANWAITVMRPGGVAYIPFKPACVDRDCLLPDRVVVFWSYTDPRDPRLVYGSDFIVVKHDPGLRKPFKIGVKGHEAVVKYTVEGLEFAKESLLENAEYPDLGSNIEVYANAEIVELETLGPLRTVGEGEINIHVEKWRLVPVAAEKELSN